MLLPSLKQPSAVVREKALRCLAMYCLLGRDAATLQQHGHIFMDGCKSPDMEVRLTAIKSLFDMGMLYGFGCLNQEELLQALSHYAVDEVAPLCTASRVLLADGRGRLRAASCAAWSWKGSPRCT